MIDLGRFEDVGYADVIRTGKSREETAKDAKRIAKKFGLKLKINYVSECPVGSVVLDIRTGRVSLEVGNLNMMFFAFDDDPESDSCNMFLVVKQDFWEQYGHLDDQHIGGMPEGFDEVMESMFEYKGTAEEGRELLLTMGYKEEKKLLP